MAAKLRTVKGPFKLKTGGMILVNNYSPARGVLVDRDQKQPLLITMYLPGSSAFFYLPSYLSIYIGPTSYRIGTKMKPDINSVEVHGQLSHNRHPIDGALVGAGSLSLRPQFVSNSVDSAIIYV
jgi:hypothetical protein